MRPEAPGLFGPPPGALHEKAARAAGNDVRARAAAGHEVDGEYWAGVNAKLDATQHKTRFVDVQTLCTALNQGAQCLATARAKWDDRQYDVALERYVGGASALEFLRVRNAEDAAKLATSSPRTRRARRRTRPPSSGA